MIIPQKYIKHWSGFTYAGGIKIPHSAGNAQTTVLKLIKIDVARYVIYTFIRFFGNRKKRRIFGGLYYIFIVHILLLLCPNNHNAFLPINAIFSCAAKISRLSAKMRCGGEGIAGEK